MAGNRRDTNIELLRLLACLCVVAIHTAMVPWVNGQVDTPALAMACIAGDAVAVFFSITGCFWFLGKKTWGGVILRFLKGILLPAVLLVLACQILTPWLGSPSLGLTGALARPDGKQLLKGLIHWDYSLWPVTCGHLWYVFTMAELVLWYPLLHLAARPGHEKPLLAVIGVDFVLRVITETALCLPRAAAWLPAGINYLPPALTELLLGFVLWQKREKLRKPVMFWWGLLLFSVTTALRVLVQQWFYGQYGYGVMQYWHRSWALPVILSLYMMILPLRLPEWLGRIIRSLSGCTFGVFLIHVAVIEKLNSLSVLGQRGLIPWLQSFMACLTPSTWINRILYSLVSAGLVFGICVIPVWLFRRLWQWMGTLKKAEKGGKA